MGQFPLNVSSHTVLAARDRAQLVVIAYSTGLAAPPTPPPADP